MPFAGFKDFNDCVRKTMAKKGWKGRKGIERAKKYCGKIKHQVEDVKKEVEVLEEELKEIRDDFSEKKKKWIK